MSALFVAFLIISTAILTVIVGILGAYGAVAAVLAAFNPAQPSRVMPALMPQQGHVSGD